MRVFINDTRDNPVSEDNNTNTDVSKVLYGQFVKITSAILYTFDSLLR